MKSVQTLSLDQNEWIHHQVHLGTEVWVEIELNPLLTRLITLNLKQTCLGKPDESHCGLIFGSEPLLLIRSLSESWEARELVFQVSFLRFSSLQGASFSSSSPSFLHHLRLFLQQWYGWNNLVILLHALAFPRKRRHIPRGFIIFSSGQGGRKEQWVNRLTQIVR